MSPPSVTLSPGDYSVIVGFFLLIFLVGFWATRRKSGTIDFLLAGRTLTLPLFVMTFVSTWYGGILGVGEFSYLYGISNWVVQGLPYYVFALIFAFLLAKRSRATGEITIPDQLKRKYGTATSTLGSFLVFILMTPAPYVLMLAVLLQLITGWSFLVCLLAGTMASTIYLFYGGFRADIYTDVVEFVFMFGGFAILLPFAFVQLGGWEFLSNNLPPLHLTWHGGNSPQFIFIWFFIALWTFVDPSFYQRCHAARSGEVAKKGILISILFWIVFDFMTAAAGLYARAALPSLEQPIMAYPLLADRLLPSFAKGLFFVGMLASIMSTLNTLVLISATTLGRDLLAQRNKTKFNERSVAYTRWGIVVTAALSIWLSWSVPSVIRLWYTIGTVVIPGLLFPLVLSYFPRWSLPGKWAFTSMLSGWLLSSTWLFIGWSEKLGDTTSYPLGIEPMYPGLFLSGLIWLVGLVWRREKCRQG